MKTKVLFLVVMMLNLACPFLTGYVAAQAPEGYIEFSNFKEEFTSVTNVKAIGLGWGWQDGNPARTYSTSIKNAIDSTFIYCNSAYTTESVETPTLLITPPLKGSLSFHVKPQATTEYYVNNYLAQGKCWIRLYLGHKEGDAVVFDEDPFFEHKFISLPDESERLNEACWISCSEEIGDDYMFVGIQLSYVGLDNLCADAYLLPKNRDLRCVKFEIDNFKSEDASPFYPDEEGQSVFHGMLTLTNQGNVTLMPGDENYSVTIQSQSTGQITIPDTEIAVSKTCSPNDTISIPVDIVMTMANTQQDQRTALRAIPGLVGSGLSATDNGVYAQTPWFTIKSLLPKLYVFNTTNTESVSEYNTYIGLQAAPARVGFKMKSRGGSPVVIDSIISTIPGTGYELDGQEATFPFQIPMGTDTMLTVVFSTPGAYTGTMDFYFTDHQGNVQTLNSQDIHITVYDTALYMEPFDYYLTVPEGWCQPGWLNMAGSHWGFNSASNNTYAVNGLRENSDSYLISPKLHFDEGQSFIVCAQPRTQASDVFLKVLVSTNRRDWQVVGFLGTTEEAVEQGVDTSVVQNWYLEGYNSKNQSLASVTEKYCIPYTVNIPEGDWYVAFGSGYALIDYVAGGSLAHITHDFYVQYDGPARGVQDEVYYADFIVRNMLDKAYTKRDYKVQLRYQDDGVYSPVRSAIEPMAIDTFALHFTPERAGTQTIVAEILVDDEVIADYTKTIEVSLPIRHILTSEEKSVSTTAPLNMNYRISRTEWVYTAEQLEGADTICSISLPFYNSEKAISNTTTIYLSETEDAAADSVAGFSDVSTMTKVYDCSTLYPVDGSAKYHSLITFNFSDPFIRTNDKNLRVVFMAEDQAVTGKVYFECETVENSLLEHHANYSTTVTARPSASMPVAWIGLPALQQETTNSAIHVAEQSASKVILNGRLYIRRGGQLFSIDGRRVR
ncbi:MAG: hypothetical protein ACI4BD_03410 [Paludibacteraceae bacterium]